MKRSKVEATLCLLIGRDYATHIHSFESLGVERKAIEDEIIYENKPDTYGYFIDDVQVEFVVGLLYGCDPNIANYFRDKTEHIITFEQGVTDGFAYNEMFRKCESDWVVITQPNVFVKRHWLTDLIFYGKIIAKSGAVGLADSMNSCKYLPMLSTDDEAMINVFIPDSNTLDTRGIWLFARQNLFFVGAFTEELELRGCEITHWQLRGLGVGLTNYYIPTHTCMIAVPLAPPKNCDAMEKSIKEMKKQRNYYIAL